MSIRLHRSCHRPFRTLMVITAAVSISLSITACSDDTKGTTTTSSSVANSRTTETITSPPIAPSNLFTVEVKSGKVQPAASRHSVPLGEMVVVEVTSDTNDEIHVHGYDKSAALTAGTTGRVSFAADMPGVFEVELEHAHRKLLELEVR